MKKAMLVALMITAVCAGTASAATTGETLKNESKKWGSFWDREGERSGLKESTSSWGRFWDSANPVNFFRTQEEAYNARKAGVQK